MSGSLGKQKNAPQWDDVKHVYQDVREAVLKELNSKPTAEWDALDTVEEKAAVVRLLIENRMMELGYVPKTFSHRGDCLRCGSVPLDFIPSAPLKGCPWCHLNAKPTIYPLS